MPNIINHTFAGDEELFSYVGEKANLLTGCCICGLVWPLKRKLKDLKSPETFWKISSAIFMLNARRFSAKQLRELVKNLSFANICPECFFSELPSYVDEVQKSQSIQGFLACFYSGQMSCDQYACMHRTMCIRDENISPTTEEYFTHLFETAFIPISINAH